MATSKITKEKFVRLYEAADNYFYSEPSSHPFAHEIEHHIAMEDNLRKVLSELYETYKKAKK